MDGFPPAKSPEPSLPTPDDVLDDVDGAREDFADRKVNAALEEVGLLLKMAIKIVMDEITDGDKLEAINRLVGYVDATHRMVFEELHCADEPTESEDALDHADSIEEVDDGRP